MRGRVVLPVGREPALWGNIVRILSVGPVQRKQSQELSPSDSIWGGYPDLFAATSCLVIWPNIFPFNLLWFGLRALSLVKRILIWYAIVIVVCVDTTLFKLSHEQGSKLKLCLEWTWNPVRSSYSYLLFSPLFMFPWSPSFYLWCTVDICRSHNFDLQSAIILGYSNVHCAQDQSIGWLLSW